MNMKLKILRLCITIFIGLKKANELDHLGIFSENEKTIKIIEWPDLIKTPLTNKLEIQFRVWTKNDKERKMKIIWD